MYTHDYKKRIRYGETDQMGYLYYGRYADLYEIGRIEWLRSVGIRYRDMEAEHGIMLPVKSLQVRYLRPVFFDDLITIKTTLREMPGKEITFHTELFNENGKLVNAGTVTLVFVDMHAQKTIAVPRFLVEKISPYFAGE